MSSGEFFTSQFTCLCHKDVTTKSVQKPHQTHHSPSLHLIFVHQPPHITMLLQTTIRPVARRALLSSSSSAKSFTRTFTAFRSPVLRQTLTPVRHHKQLPGAQFASKRFFTTEPAIVARPTRPQSIQRLLYAGGVFGGTLLAVNFLFNHESREGSIPLYERAYLQETFTYTGLGVGMIGLAAKGLHNVGWSHSLMRMNPWLILGGGLAASVGTMFATMATDPDK